VNTIIKSTNIDKIIR